MAWLRTNVRWVALNLFAVSILSVVLTQGSTDWSATHTFDPGLESGKWAIRFLLLCLGMSPLNTYFRWTSAIKLRKSAGLWAFGFAVLHVFFYTSDTGWLTLVSAAASVSLRHVFSYISDTGWTWLTVSMQPFMALGLLGLLVLTALAITSNRWAMRRLKKYWKRLHRLVYVAGLSVVFHAILATNASKKLFIRDPEAIHELRLYLAVMVVLLVVRIPVVRRLLKQIPLLFLRHRRRAGLQVTPVTLPGSPPEYPPKVNGREAGLPADDFLPEAHYEEEAERLPTP